MKYAPNALSKAINKLEKGTPLVNLLLKNGAKIDNLSIFCKNNLPKNKLVAAQIADSLVNEPGSLDKILKRINEINFTPDIIDIFYGRFDYNCQHLKDFNEQNKISLLYNLYSKLLTVAPNSPLIYSLIEHGCLLTQNNDFQKYLDTNMAIILSILYEEAPCVSYRELCKQLATPMKIKGLVFFENNPEYKDCFVLLKALLDPRYEHEEFINDINNLRDSKIVELLNAFKNLKLSMSGKLPLAYNDQLNYFIQAMEEAAIIENPVEIIGINEMITDELLLIIAQDAISMLGVNQEYNDNEYDS